MSKRTTSKNHLAALVCTLLLLTVIAACNNDEPLETITEPIAEIELSEESSTDNVEINTPAPDDEAEKIEDYEDVDFAESDNSGPVNLSTDSDDDSENNTQTRTIGQSIGRASLSFQTELAIFSISDAYDTTPADILREISYSGGFGGGDFSEPCLRRSSDGPYITSYQNVEGNLEWLINRYFEVCGWPAGESLTMSIAGSNGEVVYANTVENLSPGFDFIFTPGLNVAPGMYTLQVVGESATVDYSFTVSLPASPRLYLVEESLVLFNFQPYENVRLLKYSPENDIINCEMSRRSPFDFYGCGLLAAWQQFQVDENGRLEIYLGYQGHPRDHIIIGGDTGEVTVFGTYIPPFSSVLSSAHLVNPFRPTEADLKEVPSLWSLTRFRDLRTPGVQTYDVTIQANDTWQWRFLWCAVNPNTLQSILEPLTIEFRINGIRQTDQQIREYSHVTPTGWSCRGWAVLLTDWTANETIVLEINYSLATSIHDGQSSYPPGEYSQIMNVTVEP